jgi:HEAT repeat protein
MRNARSIANAAAGIDVQLAALAALARIGDPRGRPAFVRYAGVNTDNRFRALSIWGLGRLPDETAGPELIAALEGRQANVVVAACFGLGRHATPGALQSLFALAADPKRPIETRRAAIIGIGHASARNAAVRDAVTSTLVELLDSGDVDLAQAAAMGLAWSRDPRGLFPLLSRAVLPHRYALPDATVPLEALAAWQVNAVPPDEARQLAGPLIDVDALVALPPAALAADLTPLWRAHTRELQDLLAEALGRGGEARRDALAALDSRPDGPGLGALTSDDTALGAETVAATREVVQPLTDKLASLLDEPDVETRAAALRLLAKLGDDRVTPARIAAAAFEASPVLAAAAAFAAARVSAAKPTQAPAIAAALAPVLGDDAWRRRIAAVDALAGLGPAGTALLERTRGDRHAVVRAAAVDAITKKP